MKYSIYFSYLSFYFIYPILKMLFLYFARVCLFTINNYLLTYLLTDDDKAHSSNTKSLCDYGFHCVQVLLTLYCQRVLTRCL